VRMRHRNEEQERELSVYRKRLGQRNPVRRWGSAVSELWPVGGRASEARGTASDDSTHGRYWVVPLRPQEIRFLRKYLGYSGADFARVIGVSPETLSRWENGKAEPSRMVDLLLRYMALTRDPLTEYPPVAPSVVEELPKQIDRKASTPSFQLRETGNHWRPQPAAA
jgi:DNA-binding transcriptional regulator YiaG